jgi:hypothetical protein
MRLIILAFFLHIGVLCASDEALVSGGESPDKQFRVVLIAPEEKDEQQYAQPMASIRHVPSGKIIGKCFVGGYANFDGAKDPFNTEVLWSPNSRYAAIRSRTGKRTGGVEIFQVSRKGIQQVKTEDYVHDILRELGTEQINRYCFEKPLRWLSSTELLLDVTGDCIIGPRESGLWRSFHYEVCIEVKRGQTKWIKRLELKDEIGQTQTIPALQRI